MSDEREDGREPLPAPPDADASDPLVTVVEALVAATGLPASEAGRRVREALPAALTELAESNRLLRETMRRRDALVGSAAEQLRAASETMQLADEGSRREEAARLLSVADDLDRSLLPAAEPDVARRRPTPGGPRPRILVSDDDADAREALVELLAPECDVLTAANGEEAVEIAREEHPDIVLMDLYMPRLDGLQALERIRADPATADVPVIFVSARGDDSVKARALDLGAVDYLQKPFSDRELRARVERTLRLARSQTALRTLAQTDPLTGLANLRAFRARLEDEVKRARRYRTPLTCVMADMDHLKPVNDEFGHAVGDRAIATVAAVIQDELRETDFGARYGGDEFVLLLPHTGAVEGRVLAERICARLRDTVVEAAGHRVPVGASFGVACLPLDLGDAGADVLMRAADAALYRAKRTGRSRVAVVEAWENEGPREQA